MADPTNPRKNSGNESAPKPSVLLVNGARSELAPLRAMLESPEYELVEAPPDAETYERLNAPEVAAVLVEVGTADNTGFGMAERVRAEARFRPTPLIFIAAGDLTPAQIERAYALGAVDVCLQPLSAVALRAKVRGFVDLFQANRGAKREADLLRVLVQGTVDYAIFMLNPDGRIATWNTGAERLYGYPASEIIGKHFSSFYPQEALDRDWPNHELRVAASEGRFEDEGWRLRKDGSQFWANVVITALRDDQGQLVGFSKVTRDLTARKQAEERLRRSEERFRLLVEEAKDYAIFMLDPQGYIVSWNEGAQRIKQYTAEDIIGQHFSKFLPWRRRLRSGRAWSSSTLGCLAWTVTKLPGD